MLRVAIIIFTLLGLTLLGPSLWAADPRCRAYPHQKRAAYASRIPLDAEAGAFSSRGRVPRRARAARISPLRLSGSVRIPQRVNLIDDHIFSKMEAAGVQPAPIISDQEFLRRVMLDLTGSIPTPEQVRTFLNDRGATKRSTLIQSLIGSDAFVDFWTKFFANQFQVTSQYYNLIGIPGRNLFHNYLRDFVERDRPYRDVARELISASGDTHQLGPPNFLMRGMQQGDPIQDTWDFLTNRVTTIFLGVQTQCVSCHDGEGHLEEINLYLAARERTEFMRLSAFFSRLNIAQVAVDAFGQQQKGIVIDRSVGAYHGIVEPENPGPRPPRSGGPYTPTYMFDGQRPQSGAWREELARLVTGDRQFARATVNYLWAHFFRVGIVDPPDGWDLNRIDPSNPPPAPWEVQPTHPALLEALTDEFIAGNYRIRPIIRLLAESGAYQLSSRYPGEWKPEYAPLFAKHFPRRLSAEEIYDAMSQATLFSRPFFVDGFEQPLTRAMQLPDPSEPRYDAAQGLLAFFGIGDWWRNPRTSRSSVIQVLFMMNDYEPNQRTFGNSHGWGSTRVARLTASLVTDEEAVQELFLATLGRDPAQDELATVLDHRKGDREQWLSDVQWALLNKADFLFNY